MVMTDGVHGPVLGPVEMLVINVVLITISFFLLCRPTHSAKREILVLTSITAAAAASRILLEPFPNVQPLTVMCLVMGASLGAAEVWHSQLWRLCYQRSSFTRLVDIIPSNRLGSGCIRRL